MAKADYFRLMENNNQLYRLIVSNFPNLYVQKKTNTFRCLFFYPFCVSVNCQYPEGTMVKRCLKQCSIDVCKRFI